MLPKKSPPKMFGHFLGATKYGWFLKTLRCEINWKTNWSNCIQTLQTWNYEPHKNHPIFPCLPTCIIQYFAEKVVTFDLRKLCRLVQGSRVFHGIVIDGSHEDDIQLQRFHDGSLDKCHPRSPCHLHSEDLHLNPARVFLVWTKMWNKNHIKILNSFYCN